MTYSTDEEFEQAVKKWKHVHPKGVLEPISTMSTEEYILYEKGERKCKTRQIILCGLFALDTTQMVTVAIEGEEKQQPCTENFYLNPCALFEPRFKHLWVNSLDSERLHS